MLIILEGPDGAGKSTLAETLAELLDESEHARGVIRLHRGPPTAHPLDEYLRPITGYRPGRSPHMILDRWHWGERIYPQIRGRTSQLDDPTWWTLEGYLARLGAIVVYVTQYTDEYKRVYHERGELDQLAELPAVEAAYRRVRRQSFQLQTTFNRQSPIDGDVGRIIRTARLREAFVADIPGTTYVGPRYPEFLLFGDVRHELRGLKLDSALSKLNWDPAFLPFPNTSGHFLRQALADAEATPRYGLANACDVDDPVALWKAVGQPRVVALGRRAQRELRRLGVPHGAVPHPQYVRRFHHSDRAEYGRLIGLALTKQEDYAGWPASSPVDTAGTSTLRFSRTSAGAARAVPAATA